MAQGTGGRGGGTGDLGEVPRTGVGGGGGAGDEGKGATTVEPPARTDVGTDRDDERRGEPRRWREEPSAPETDQEQTP